MSAPIQAAQMTHFPYGASSFGFPLVGKTTGRVFFVDSTNNNKGDDLNHGNSPSVPFSTIAYAVAQANAGANRGDVVYVLPGHTETITSLGAITLSVAGVKVVGLGEGRDRPKVTLSSSTDASIVVSAANCRIENIVVDMTGIDSIGQGGSGAGGIRVQEADFSLVGCELIIATASNQVKNAIGLSTSANRCAILHNLIAGSATAGPNSAIELYGAGLLTVEGLEIGWNRIVGDFAVAGISLSMTDTLLNAYIHDNIITATGTAQACLSLNVSGAGTSGVVANNKLLGTDSGAVYATTTAGIANVDNYGYDINDDGQLGVFVPVVGSSLPADTSLIDQIIGQEFSWKQANYRKVTADFSSATWNTVAKHEILTVTGPNRVIIIPVCIVDLTSGGAATIQLGHESTTDALIAATTATDIDQDEFWFTTTPAKFAAKSAVLDCIVNGLDIGYEILVAALTGGQIDFHIWTVPLANGALVTSGTGSAL